MNFELTEEQNALFNLASSFSEKHLAPFSAEWDEKHIFPKDTLKEAAKLGLAAITAKEEYGGSGLSRLDSALIFEGLSKGCVSTAAWLSIHNMVVGLIDEFGSDVLRARFIPKLSTLTLSAAYCLTEPEAGSDAKSLQTRAVLEGDHYIINGAKAFISGGGESTLYLCMVRTGDASHHGISAILVEKETEGLRFGPPEKKMGWRNQPTTMVYFENCKVPAENLVGEEGMGFKIALHALNGGRVNIAACSLGGAFTCLQLTQSYLKTRKQFGKTLHQMQSLRFQFSEMLSQFYASRLLIYQAASMLDKKDENAPQYVAMAKRFATEKAFQISDSAMQLHGGYGYLHDYQIERIFRDLRVHRILEGTNEIMQEIIAKAFLDEERPI